MSLQKKNAETKGGLAAGSIGHSPPSISLPKGGGALHGMGEKFAANPVTGTGSMTVPVATSPGRSGFGPELSLTYDSGSGNGPFGFGWHLSLPSITRKTDKGLPQYIDAEESDVFILSGAEDLVPEFEKDAGGNWVLQNGEHVIAEKPRVVNGTSYMVRRYRPRVEGLFARIERWTNLVDATDTSWRSISKDNVTTWYGKTAESRVFDPEDASHVFSWLICESHDDKGNVVVYGYKAEDSSAIDLAQVRERNRGGKTDPRRSANRYLKRIRYGNHEPYLPTLSDTDFWPQPAGLNEVDASNDWHFEVVLDYGEHDEANPRPDDAGVWPVRNDPFSSYRSCFEIRTYRLCQRVLLFHHFPDEQGVGAGCLVRSTDFDYSYEERPTDVRNPIYSFLLSVTQCGFKRQTGGGYLKRSLPPIEFDYSEVPSPEEIVRQPVRELRAESLENLPVGLDGTSYQWLDLDGEGSSGILTEQADGWYYKRNLSANNQVSENGHQQTIPRFGPTQLIATRPAVSLARGAQFLDLAGDGHADLVQMEGAVRGFYDRTDDGDWEPFRPFDSWPDLDTHDPDLKFVDLTGDGHADILITEADVLTWYPSLAEEGFGPALRVSVPLDEEKGPRLVFADGTQSIYLADLSGDGLSDLVRIRNGEVCYWPNLGYGRFAAKVTMDNAPWFDLPEQFDQRRVRLADTDGSGTTDILYLRRDGIQIYFNQSGNGWSNAVSLTQFPRTDNTSSVQAVDLLGSGTACLVWSSSLPSDTRCPMRYIDLMEQKPHLLIRTVNNLGAETVVSYAPSTKFYLQDEFDGKPWITKLPFPVHVVERVETYDRISGNRFVSRYTYHHGYFDGVEREFRGFGLVEQSDTEEIGTLSGDESSSLTTNLDAASFVPPIRTKTWFHTGASIQGEKISRHFEHEYFGAPEASDPNFDQDWKSFEATLLNDTMLPPDLTVEEAREACRALKGAMLRQEVYADDAPIGAPEEIVQRAKTPYTVTEQNFTIKPLQPLGGNRHAVFFTNARETLSYHYERNPDDPRIGHAMTLEVDGYGNVLKTVAIGYGRKQSPLTEQFDQDKQIQTLLTYTENSVTNAINDTANLDDYRIPLPAEAITFELTGLSPENNAQLFSFDELTRNTFAILSSATEIGYEEIADPAKTQKRPVEHVRMLYRKDDLTGLLPLGQVQAIALPGENYKLAFTPGLISQIYKRKIGTSPEENLLPNPAQLLGSTAADGGGYVDLDGNGNWWVPSGRIFFDVAANTSAPSTTAALELAQARSHFFLSRIFTDPFQHSSRVDYDPYNLLVIKIQDALQNTINALHDYRVQQPFLVTDPNGNRTAAAFDALGLVVATAVMGKVSPAPVEGDLLEGFDPDPALGVIQAFIADPQGKAAFFLGKATSRIVYDLGHFDRCSQPPFAASLLRETHFANPGGPATKIQISFAYSDGFGREIQKKIEAEPGDAPQREANIPLPTGDIRPGDLVRDLASQLIIGQASPRWVGTGRTVFNNKGKPVRQYEPFFSFTHLYESEPEMTDTGVTPIIFYDPAERVVATVHPNHSWEKVVFDAWQQQTYDVNDTVLNADGSTDPKLDKDVEGFFSRLPVADYLPTWFEQRSVLPLTNPERIAVDKTSVHRQTPTIAHFDVLGRPFLTIVHNRFVGGNGIVEENYPARVELDIEGNQRVVRDAVVQNGDNLGRVVMRYDYDMLSNRIHQASMEAGERWMLNDVTGKLIRAWDSRGFVRRAVHDELRRVRELFVNKNGVERLAERIVYGEVQGVANNHCTRVHKVFDGAGCVTNQAYDFKGNLLRGTRDLLPDYKQAVDWQQNPNPNDGTFISAAAYDALNRPVTVTSPDGSIYRPRFNEANLLDKVDVNLRATKDVNGQSIFTAFVTNIDYNAKGQRELIQYDNGAATSYEYDPLTFRLTRLRTTRPIGSNGLASILFSDPAVIQDLYYTYDPAGNISRIADKALARLSNSGQPDNEPSDYTYDAIYRLTEATGREHIGQTARDFNPQNRRDYDFAGLADIVAHPNDLQAMQRYTERYEYDAVGNFQFVRHVANGGGWTRGYEYNEDSLTEPAKKSNRLSNTKTGNGLNSSESYTYADAQGTDVHGCITAIDNTKMAWDFKDQLQHVDLGGGGAAYYLYDAGGQRVRKVIENQNGARQKERIYLGGFEVYREYDGSGTTKTLERESLNVRDDKQQIALVETQTIGNSNAIDTPSPLSRYQLGNHLGSTSLELSEDGALVSYEEYYPYGTTSFQAGGSAAELSLKRYRYTGKERDEENGFYYHGARYYAPWLGRWTASDPIGIEVSMCSYEYSLCNPIKYLDPNGREPRRGQLGTSAQIADEAQKALKPVSMIRRDDANARAKALGAIKDLPQSLDLQTYLKVITEVATREKTQLAEKGNATIQQSMAIHAQYRHLAETELVRGLSDLRDHFEADRFFKKDDKTNAWGEDIGRADSRDVKRYVYTEKLGWIDMHHFYYFAASTAVSGPDVARQVGKNLEKLQGTIGRDASSYSYEDLPSNEAGVQFYQKYGEALLSGRLSIVEATKLFLNEAGAVDPSKAPNIDYIPQVIRNNDPPMKNTSPTPLTGSALKKAHEERFQKASEARKKEIIEGRGIK